ncbi:MAG: hypothetical protein BGO28_03780 [Alphaproteobacteria bacterium 43-37]|nr:MAG: hypothetical protein BGO28_03780 [Alphaproteobacteria bacterium 43-37]
MNDIKLIIEGGGGEPLFSAAHCTQEFSLVRQGMLTRTVNGEMVYLGNADHQKYITQIRGKDSHAPALENLWRGREVIVHCIQFLTQEIASGVNEVVLSKLPCPQSIRVLGFEGDTPVHHISEKAIFLETESSHKRFLRYRPLLKMMVVDVEMSIQEKQNLIEWSIHLEEI